DHRGHRDWCGRRGGRSGEQHLHRDRWCTRRRRVRPERRRAGAFVTNALAFHANFRGDDPMQSPAAVMTLRQLAGSKLRRSEEGQDLLEYGLLMALIAIFAIGAVSVLGNTIQNVFWSAIAGNF